jgi:hypothetical protein
LAQEPNFMSSASSQCCKPDLIESSCSQKLTQDGLLAVVRMPRKIAKIRYTIKRMDKKETE